MPAPSVKGPVICRTSPPVLRDCKSRVAHACLAAARVRAVLLAALSLVVASTTIAWASPVGAHDAPAAPEPSCPSGAVAVLVDASSEPDLYAAHLVAGVLDTGCVVDSGSRATPDLPASSAALLDGLSTGFVLGGSVAVPSSKLPAHIAWSRIGGVDRWETLRLAGRMATGEWTPPRVQLGDPAEGDTTSEDADTTSEDADTSSEVAEAEIDAAEAEMARLVNELRSGLGLAPLAYNPDLAAVARRWSQTMRDEDTFAHNPTYSEQYPAGWRRAGENIAWRQSDGSILDKVRAAFDGLVDSPGHYANMTHPDFNHLGVGVAVEGRSLWVTQNLAHYP